VDIEPPEAGTGVYGAAVDIGTSKIVVYLFDLAGGGRSTRRPWKTRRCGSGRTWSRGSRKP